MKTEITWRTDEPPQGKLLLIAVEPVYHDIKYPAEVRSAYYETFGYSFGAPPQYIWNDHESQSESFWPKDVLAWAHLPEPPQVQSGCSEDSDVKEPST